MGLMVLWTDLELSASILEVSVFLESMVFCSLHFRRFVSCGVSWVGLALLLRVEEYDISVPFDYPF
jgi:hypothetical protein